MATTTKTMATIEQLAEDTQVDVQLLRNLIRSLEVDNPEYANLLGCYLKNIESRQALIRLHTGVTA